MSGLIDEQKALINIHAQLENMFDTIYETPTNTYHLVLQIGALSHYVKHFLHTHDIKLKDDE